ncbi:MAG: DVUA0089 family protein, partial [Planctomycetes bacterium]|nr:DVUA0089 family protein [Planctomycetota bacterium]
MQPAFGSGPLTQIVGNLGTGDVDLYLIHVDDPATFTCSSLGGAGFDTQLWIFDRQGYGISFKDDDGPAQSTLTGQFISAPGHVVIGITQYDTDPLDASNQELWLDQPYNVERQPDGPGASNVFTQWSGSTGGGGAYTLTLAGASYAAPATLQEPINAWAWVDPYSFPGQQLFVPSLSYQHTPTGELVWVRHVNPGHFSVQFPDSLPHDGNYQVSAYGGNHTAVIDWWGHNNGKLECWVTTFDTAGNFADRAFTCHYRKGGQPTEIAGYLWANQETNPQYTPLTSHSWNGNRPDPTITRYAAGLYRCRFPGIANPLQGGTFEVSVADGGVVWFKRAQIDSWGVSPGTTDLDIFVRTFSAGTQVDAMFMLNYHLQPGQVAPSDGSGSYVWANQPTAASYSPPSGHHRSNGTYGPHNSETITRTGTGQYRVTMPDVASRDSSVPTAVTRAQNGDYATITGWSSSGSGTAVNVRTYNAASNPTDAEFFLNYTTNRPAGTLATNTIIGHGCGSTLLSPLTRPIAGTGWTYQVSQAPAGASLGFILLGLSNPNLDLTSIGMTGCVRYTDQLAIALMPGT